MIESPLIQELRAEAIPGTILRFLKARFKAVPRDITKRLREILDEKKLAKLTDLVAKCPDLDTFRDALPP